MTEDQREPPAPLARDRALAPRSASTATGRQREAEEYMENISRVFEEEKHYLVQRWDQSLKAHGVAKVADLLAPDSSD